MAPGFEATRGGENDIAGRSGSLCTAMLFTESESRDD